MTSDPRVRLATEADLPALRALIPASVRALSRGFYSEAQIESALRFVFGPDTQLIADGTYFAVEVGARLAGCGGWSRRRTLYGGDQHKDTEDPLLDPARDAARIRAFFVHPEQARRGIGRALLERCEAEARAAGFTALELMATLPGARLYRAAGYVGAERVTHRLAGGVDIDFVPMRKVV